MGRRTGISGGAAQDFVRQVEKIRAQASDGDLTTGRVLKALSQVCRCLSVTAC
jgi:hypothetical protein